MPSAIVNKLVSGPMVPLHLLCSGNHTLPWDIAQANRSGASGAAIFAVSAPNPPHVATTTSGDSMNRPARLNPHKSRRDPIYKWRHRDSVHDRSYTAHRLQTTLTPTKEAVAVALRKTLLVSLDDLLAVVREFLNPNASRSGLDRCLRRHGVGNLRDLKAKDARPKHSGFKAYEPGYIHIDVKYLP